ncbi:pentatricopeptide repeat-containing protein At1g66345, mitochondrial [Juglans microcarpa x Juglans regia]|uniref:pentatricopeptide repeat-containing protein At1g66345, mitochondrial n=1 Tax=Juglans microcarpa x Juglans regia TaxID=2249226 RepID=UPI001B7E7CBD|nr:pentatricopeptide repeat-containing protein At1g66345, mitochondrial [Juglans microcarpa x Juglans regia]
MLLLRRIIPSLVFVSVGDSISLCVYSSKPVVAEFIHNDAKANCDTVDSICSSFRRGWNWDRLTQKFDTFQLNDLIVEKVLLELKEPNDAKRALAFFHWSAQRKTIEHGIRSYCITIHILVRARLLMDARALLESVLKKSVGYSLPFSIVDILLSSYKITASSPFVFDLLIQAYAKLRMFDIAFDACHYLEEHGFSLSLISFNALIHVVQKSDQVPLVWKIYEHMIQKRIYPNEVTIRTMTSALCKEGQLQKYVDILDQIHGKKCSPSVIVNTSLVLRILEERRVEHGMVLLKRMLQKNMILDTIAYSLIVHAKIKLGDLESAYKAYEEMLKRGFQANSFIYTLFIGAHCKEGKIKEAHCLMQEMENMDLKPNEESFDLLIEGCAKAGKLEESLRYCEQMLERRLVPSRWAFNEMVGKLCQSGDVEQANAMLTILLDKGFLPDEVTYSHLIDGYGSKGEIDEVLKLYYEIEYKSLSPVLLVYKSLIRSLCLCGKLEEAEKYLRKLKERSLVPTVCIYDTLIASYSEKGDRTRVLHLQNEMISLGLKPSCS